MANILDYSSKSLDKSNFNKLPHEIVKKIKNKLEKFIKCDECLNSKKYSPNLLKKCSYCKRTNLCSEHYKIGQKWAKVYDNSFTQQSMCDMCCWWEVS